MLNCFRRFLTGNLPFGVFGLQQSQIGFPFVADYFAACEAPHRDDHFRAEIDTNFDRLLKGNDFNANFYIYLVKFTEFKAKFLYNLMFLQQRRRTRW